MHFTDTKSSPWILLLLKHKNNLAPTEKQINQINTLWWNKEKGSLTVRAKENLKLNHGVPSQRQALGTNDRLKFYVRAVNESEAWPIIVQLKRKP